MSSTWSGLLFGKEANEQELTSMDNHIFLAHNPYCVNHTRSHLDAWLSKPTFFTQVAWFLLDVPNKQLYRCFPQDQRGALLFATYRLIPLQHQSDDVVKMMLFTTDGHVANQPGNSVCLTHVDASKPIRFLSCGELESFVWYAVPASRLAVNNEVNFDDLFSPTLFHLY